MAGVRYNVTVQRRVPGAKWQRLYIGPKGGIHLNRRVGDRGAFWKNEVDSARKWASKRLFRIRVVELKQNPFKKLEAKHGLRRSSGDNDAVGVHSRKSYHYRIASWGGVQAYDYGTARNTKAKLVAAGNSARKEAHKWAEVFGPFNFWIKDGVLHEGPLPAVFGDHSDHLHAARVLPL